MSEPAGFFRLPPSRTSKRWLLVLLASALLHWSVIEWANGNLAIPLQASQDEPVIMAQLQAAPLGKPEPEPRSAPRRQAKPRPARPLLPAAQEVPLLVPDQAPPVGTPLATGGEGSEDAPSLSDLAAEASAPSAQNDEGATETDSGAAWNLPPPAELQYDVQAQKKGFTYYGTGLINWQTDGSRYLITGKAKAAFFTVLEFTSEGEVDHSGIAPILYAERAGTRAETNTHFHRERSTISFSASTLSYPRLGGEQDRASVIWQLAALGRATPELFKPGQELSIFVAGVRNAAPWRIFILGEEEVLLDGASMRSWHVKSVPQQGGYEKTFDIWFASGYEWYPVKLRQTEVSGDYLELTLSNPAPAHH